jgi:hypothetical protein
MVGKVKKIFVVMVVLVGVHTVIYGHGGSKSHSHEKVALEQTRIESIANEKVKRFVLAKKLDSSWNSGTMSKVEKKVFDNRAEWVVTFYNAKEVDSKKKTLYIFVDIYGKFTGANFTGE